MRKSNALERPGAYGFGAFSCHLLIAVLPFAAISTGFVPLSFEAFSATSGAPEGGEMRCKGTISTIGAFMEEAIREVFPVAVTRFASVFPVLLVAVGISTAFDLPDNPPVPEMRPDDLGTVQEPAKAGEAQEAEAEPEKDDAGKAAADPAPPAEDPAAYAACLKQLSALGAQFKERDTINDSGACGIDKPLDVSMAVEGVPLKPVGTMRCETALALANWVADYVEPSARIAFGADTRLAEIDQASTYICRSRNSVAGAKISEHSKGNAIDIGSLTFSNGKSIDMEPRKQDGTLTGAFQRTVSASACLYFTTVLSPGSDATHQDHMHLDVIERNRGYRYCR